MAIPVELKFAAELRPIHGPARQHPGYLGDIRLRVAAIHAYSVQFHQLAGIIFVQSFGRLAFGVSTPLVYHLRAVGGTESGPTLCALSR